MVLQIFSSLGTSLWWLNRGKLGLSVKMADSLACLRGLVTGEIANICNSLYNYRIPVYLKCSKNTKASTVFACFLEAVSEFGLPSRVRSENVGVSMFMLQWPQWMRLFYSCSTAARVDINKWLVLQGFQLCFLTLTNERWVVFGIYKSQNHLLALAYLQVSINFLQ